MLIKNIRNVLSGYNNPYRVLSRLILTSGLLGLLSVYFPSLSAAQTGFTKVQTQYIAALGDPEAGSGTGAETWGIWTVDPGPRGVWLRNFDYLMKNGGKTALGWQFDINDWWLDEHGLLMEKPAFPVSAGKYVVTGGRETTAILTIHPPDENGNSKWELSDGAKLADVTHIPCRSSRFTPKDGETCTPANVDQSVFELKPEDTMPDVEGCNKQKYDVLFVVGVESK